MSLLLALWLVSLSVLVVTSLVAHMRTRFVSAHHHVPHDLGEFVHEALSHLAIHMHGAAKTMRPHTDKVTSFVVSIGKWSHGKFVDRVFGKAYQAPGKSASFFLKYIAEQKEKVVGTPKQRRGY
jgi:hypothetical protein